MFKIFSLGAMIAAVSAQTSWWTDPKAVVTAANVEFATFFNAGNFTACAGTYTENGAHYTGKGFVVGREAIAATWQAAAKGGLANVSFVTVEAIANQDANTIHEYGVATSNQWTDVKYFLRWSMDAAGNPWLESDISPIAPGTNTSSLTFAYPQAAAEAQTLPDGTKLPHPQDVVEIANKELAKAYNKKDYAACTALYVPSATFSSEPATPWGKSLNSPAAITAFWTEAAKEGIADLKFETTYAIATTDFTVIHELGRVFSNVWPAGLPYYVRWNVKKTKGKGSKATDYTAMLESDISPM